MKPVSRDILIELYINQKLKQKEIVEKMGISGRTLRRMLHSYRLFKKIGQRKDSTGHVLIYQPEHPRTRHNGYVMRAILVWEKFHNTSFPEDKEPHHDNGVPDDDRPGNIIPLTHSEHAKISNQRRRKL